MFRLFTIIFALMMVGNIHAQNKKFGKPSKEEWELTDVDFAPGAPAVVLYKSVEVKYEIGGEFDARGDNAGGDISDDGIAQMGTTKHFSPKNSSMTYDVKLRTKILTDAGREYSTIDIVYLDDEKNMDWHDDVTDLNITKFSNVDGKIKKKYIAQRECKVERLDSHYSILHIRVPEVKAGDIIEYRYKLSSTRTTFIYNDQMQEGIPVLYSYCMMEVPYFIQFNVNKPEAPQFAATAALGYIMMPPSNDLRAPKKCTCNVFTIVGRNIPAYDGVIDQQKINDGKVYTVRTELKDKTYDVLPDITGSVRHIIIGK